MDGKVVGIFISYTAGGLMLEQRVVQAISGSGLLGDRYSRGWGSFNKGAQGKRQVTLINSTFFKDSGFEYADSRRNIVTEGVELMWLIGREFQIGDARMRGVKYCDPCERPTKLAEKERSFKEAFFDRGGIVAEVIHDGSIRVGDPVIPPPKGY